MKRILMVSYRFHYPLTDGSSIRIYNVGMNCPGVAGDSIS
jgi:hypothetical protein